jgi:hypothetical protein
MYFGVSREWSLKQLALGQGESMSAQKSSVESVIKKLKLSMIEDAKKNGEQIAGVVRKLHRYRGARYKTLEDFLESEEKELIDTFLYLTRKCITLFCDREEGYSLDIMYGYKDEKVKAYSDRWSDQGTESNPFKEHRETETEDLDEVAREYLNNRGDLIRTLRTGVWKILEL